VEPSPQQGKLWVSLLGVVVAGGVVVLIISQVPRDRAIDQAAASSQQHTTFPIRNKGLAVPTSTNYVYRVVGPPGTTATISYVNQDGTDGYIKRVTLPWSIATTTSDGPGLPKGSGQPPFVEARTNTRSSNAKVTCQSYGDGTLTDQETATGSYVTVSCGFAY
jgi:hypothetical protein